MPLDLDELRKKYSSPIDEEPAFASEPQEPALAREGAEEEFAASSTVVPEGALWRMDAFQPNVETSFTPKTASEVMGLGVQDPYSILGPEPNPLLTGEDVPREIMPPVDIAADISEAVETIPEQIAGLQADPYAGPFTAVSAGITKKVLSSVAGVTEFLARILPGEADNVDVDGFSVTGSLMSSAQALSDAATVIAGSQQAAMLDAILSGDKAAAYRIGATTTI